MSIEIRRIHALAIATCLAVPAAAQAAGEQVPATAQAQESLKGDGAELAKELQNPVATLIGMPLQHHWGVGPSRAGLGVLGGAPPEAVYGAPQGVRRSKTCVHGMGDNAIRGMTI